MVPTQKGSFSLFLRAILYTCCQTRNMALLKNISLGKTAQGPPPWGGSPSSPGLRTTSPNLDRLPTAWLRTRLCFKKEDQEMDLGHIGVVVGGGHGSSGENSQLITGSDVDCNFKMSTTLAWCAGPFVFVPFCAPMASAREGVQLVSLPWVRGTPMILTPSECAA